MGCVDGGASFFARVDRGGADARGWGRFVRALGGGDGGIGETGGGLGVEGVVVVGAGPGFRAGFRGIEGIQEIFRCLVGWIG